MADDSSIALPPRDYADVVKLQDKTVLDEFLDDPSTEALAIITGAFAGGGKGLMVSAGRIAQGLLKGQVYDVFADELRRLRDAGKIPDNLGETKHGLYTWAELMRIIDDECPDAERLEALKAMFFDVNKINATDKEQMYAYQLWQITKKLSSGEVLVMKTIHADRNHLSRLQYGGWLMRIAEVSGLVSDEMVELHLSKLREYKIVYPGKSDRPSNGGISRLGISLCDNIQTYRTIIDQMKKQS